MNEKATLLTPGVLHLASAMASPNKFWVQMHGEHDGDTFDVPEHVTIVFTSTPGGYGVGSIGLSLPSSVARHLTNEKQLLDALILQHHDTYSATYTPFMKIPDLQLQFDYDDPWCGVRKAPVVKRIFRTGNHVPTDTRIVFDKMSGWSARMPAAVNIEPDIFRTSLFPANGRHRTSRNIGLLQLIRKMTRMIRPDAQRPLVLFLNTCRTCDPYLSKMLLKMNAQTLGFRGVTERAPIIPDQRDILAKFGRREAKRKRVIESIDRQTANAAFARAVKRSTKNAFRHLEGTVNGFAQGMQEHEYRIVHKNTLGRSFDSKSRTTATRGNMPSATKNTASSRK